MANTPSSKRKEAPSEPFKKALEVCTRAVAGDGEVHVAFQPGRPELIGKIVNLPEPSRVPSAREIAVLRGWADSLALTAACHDDTLHNKLFPGGGSARAAFDAIERARVEAVGANRMAGMALNLTAKIEDQYGKADRIWVMDRGIPTEDVLDQMRRSNPPVSYLVGTPKGRLTALEQSLLERDWQHARPSVRVKLLPHHGETYVLAESKDRVAKERSMRRRRLRKYLAALKSITTRKRPMQRDALHQAIGAAKKEAGRDARFVVIEVTHSGTGKRQTGSLTCRLDRAKLRQAWRREGRYLLRTNMTDTDPARLWEFYLQLTEVEQAFKELKSDLAIRPIHHQHDHRIEAHPPSPRLRRAGHLHRVHGLRPASHTQDAAQATRQRPESESHVGEVRHRADARRAPAHHRRARDHHVAPHPPREGSSTVARPTQTHPARAAPAENYGVCPAYPHIPKRASNPHEMTLRVV